MTGNTFRIVPEKSGIRAFRGVPEKIRNGRNPLPERLPSVLARSGSGPEPERHIFLQVIDL